MQTDTFRWGEKNNQAFAAALLLCCTLLVSSWSNILTYCKITLQYFLRACFVQGAEQNMRFWACIEVLKLAISGKMAESDYPMEISWTKEPWSEARSHLGNLLNLQILGPRYRCSDYTEGGPNAILWKTVSFAATSPKNPVSITHKFYGLGQDNESFSKPQFSHL